MDELYERIKKKHWKAAIKRFMQSLIKLIPLFGVLIFILAMVLLSDNKIDRYVKKTAEIEQLIQENQLSEAKEKLDEIDNKSNYQHNLEIYIELLNMEAQAADPLKIYEVCKNFNFTKTAEGDLDAAMRESYDKYNELYTSMKKQEEDESKKASEEKENAQKKMWYDQFGDKAINVGMPSKAVDYCNTGKPTFHYFCTETDKETKKKVYVNIYYWADLENNQYSTIYMKVVCRDKKISEVTRYGGTRYWGENNTPLFTVHKWDEDNYFTRSLDKELNVSKYKVGGYSPSSSGSSSGSSGSSGGTSGSSGKRIYNGNSYDPDDYDSPEDFADDAWGNDFDDWDDAYDYWEDW
ncbi:hypothetical protein [Lachnospira multipara]|uniref:hypothetical protein n=1 Tax=Lachnospira multipara TaxID=28051 RepID=UPI000409A828|nr:hypothetical protein [Lachnospira multipara]